MVLTAYLTTTLLPQCKRLIVIHVLPCVVGESGEPIWCRIRQVAVMTLVQKGKIRRRAINQLIPFNSVCM